MSQENVELMCQSVAQELSKEKIRLDTIQKSYNLLIDLIFQTMTTAKSQSTNEDRLEIISNGMQEIKKYAEQEVQKHTHALGVQAGKLQGLDMALEALNSKAADDTGSEKEGEDNRLFSTDEDALGSE